MKKLILAAATLAGACLLPGVAQAQAVPYVGQIMATGANFCPRGWTEAHGQLLPISQNDALFSLYGTIYGGDGRTTFGIPDLRGRMLTNHGQGNGLTEHRIGQKFGADTVTLTVSNLPSHTHGFGVSISEPNTPQVNNATLATFTSRPAYATPTNLTASLANQTISHTGGNQSINIQQPYIVLKWCVALFGVYPSRT